MRGFDLFAQFKNVYSTAIVAVVYIVACAMHVVCMRKGNFLAAYIGITNVRMSQRYIHCSAIVASCYSSRIIIRSISSCVAGACNS